MRKILLSDGIHETMVDDGDFEMLMRWSWLYADGYAFRMVKGRNSYRRRYMHREIVGHTEHGVIIDHIDRDRLNNQRSNYRFATRSQSQANTDKYVSGLSCKYKGVNLHKPTKRWLARITVNRQYKHLGLFDTPEEAARAYDAAAWEAWKEFAKLNFPREV